MRRITAAQSVKAQAIVRSDAASARALLTSALLITSLVLLGLLGRTGWLLTT